MDLASEIKAARTRLGLSQSQAAKTWSVPVRTLQQWEQAKQVPRGFALAKLQEILDAILADKPPVPASSAATAASASTPPAKPREQRRRPPRAAPLRSRAPKTR